MNREKTAEIASRVSESLPVIETCDNENMSPRTATSSTAEEQIGPSTSTSIETTEIASTVSESPQAIETATSSTAEEQTGPSTNTSIETATSSIAVEQTGSVECSIETPSMTASQTLSAGTSTNSDITRRNIETATAVESIRSTGASNNEAQIPDFSDVLMSPGGRSDVTVAYEDHDAPSPRTPTPTFQSPLSRSPRKSKAKEDSPLITSAVHALCANGNPAASDSERPNTPPTRRVDDPVHPPTPGKAYDSEESEEQNSGSLLEDANIFAQKADPVHLPSPQCSRTDSPVSLASVDCDRNELTPTRRSNHVTLFTPPPPSPFSALSISTTPSPEILPSTAVDEDQESQKLITSARSRINEEVER